MGIVDRQELEAAIKDVNERIWAREALIGRVLSKDDEELTKQYNLLISLENALNVCILGERREGSA